MTTLCPSDLQRLADNGYVVVENFLPASLQEELRKDVYDLRSCDYFKVAKIGHDGMVQDENTPFRDIRYSETCFIGKINEPEVKCKARTQLYHALDELKSVLDSNDVVKQGHLTKSVPSLDTEMEELMYAYYPQGGYYRRHRDAEPDSVSNWRKYSLLLYLNQDWSSKDGGELRIHTDSGGDELPVGELPNFIDVQPKSGTLVLFRSDMCPHEVLDTRKERIAIVGWFLSATEPASDPTDVPVASKTTIDPDVLLALQLLRDVSPRLASRLKPAPPADYSGMLDDFFMPGSSLPPPSVPDYPDTDPRYWRKIATFTSTGLVTTLSLGGNRLQHLESEWSATLLETVVTLDLANTDLSASRIAMVLSKCKSLRNVHLGGNALGDDGVSELLPHMHSLITVDLRYNDIVTGESLGDMLKHEDCSWTVLYLEGNRFGDSSVAAFSSFGPLRELYLGQNKVGPEGAARLAQAMHGANLKKLYLEGNHIGNTGAKAFYDVLETMENKTLEKLFCDNNGISKEEAIRLGRSLNSATLISDGGIFQD